MERRLSQAGPKKGGDTKFEFRFNTNEGRVFECYVTLSEDLQLWMSVLPQLSSEVIRGWLHKRKKGAKSKTFDRRFVIFNPKDNSLKYYLNEYDATYDKDVRGSVVVESTILYPNKFALHTTDAKFFEFFAETPEELSMWMDGLPKPRGAVVKGWVLKHKRGAKG